MGEVQDYLIRRGGGFYRPGAKGYTQSAVEAGRWSRTEALAYQKGVEGVTIHHVSEFPVPADGWAFAKQLSDALLKVRPLGGSELFVKRNGQYYADPDYCGAAIEDAHKSRHKVMKENIRLLRRVRELEAEVSQLSPPEHGGV